MVESTIIKDMRRTHLDTSVEDESGCETEEKFQHRVGQICQYHYGAANYNQGENYIIAFLLQRGAPASSLFTRMIRELDFLRFASPGGRAVTALGDALDQYFEGSKIAQVVSSVYGGSFGIVMSWIPSFFTTAGIDNDSMEALLHYTSHAVPERKQLC